METTTNSTGSTEQDARDAKKEHEPPGAVTPGRMRRRGHVNLIMVHVDIGSIAADACSEPGFSKNLNLPICEEGGPLPPDPESLEDIAKVLGTRHIKSELSLCMQYRMLDNCGYPASEPMYAIERALFGWPVLRVGITEAGNFGYPAETPYEMHMRVNLSYTYTSEASSDGITGHQGNVSNDFNVIFEDAAEHRTTQMRLMLISEAREMAYIVLMYLTKTTVSCTDELFSRMLSAHSENQGGDPDK